ncbi:MAG TPA: competence/damage-inducible protein A [Phycisphaerae bacterium]|nr:competence/damage-inducible protein A [Phycisphaerae bacterium]
MNAIIIAVGTELTSGQTIDTNSAYLAERLAGLGIDALEHRTVGDERAAISAAIKCAAAAAELVVVTGGLGPTADDLSRHGLADAMGAELSLDGESLRAIEDMFRRRGRRMAESNRVQAMVPAGARALPNRMGTAPGLAAAVGGARVYVMPGVPAEMRRMFEEAVAPRLPQGQGAIVCRTIHTFGAGESDVGAKIADLMARDADPLVGTTAAAGLVTVRIRCRAGKADEAQRRIDAAAAEIRRRLGELVVGEGNETMASAVGSLLRARGQTLATAESCTGGMLGAMITAVPGSSDYYLGGMVAYCDRLKQELLGVPGGALSEHGAVSEPVAAAMAEGCRRRCGADWAVAVTGIAGPGGGSQDKPVGLVFIALAGEGETHVQRHVFGGTREMVRVRSSLAALNALRMRIG